MWDASPRHRRAWHGPPLRRWLPIAVARDGWSAGTLLMKRLPEPLILYLPFFPLQVPPLFCSVARTPCDSSQVPGDVCCPGIYGFPVAEVAFGSPNRLYHHPFSERQSLVVECSEKDPLFPGPNGLLELRHLLGLLLGILDFV